MQKVVTFLMFEEKAEEAMTFYVSLFKDSAVVSAKRYGPGMPGKEGSLMHATFTLAGQTYMCIDSAIKHNFTFTPSMSLYVTCESDEEIEGLYPKLSQGGSVMMPLGPYPFSPKFAWVVDRFGVAWQMNLLK